MDGFRPRGRCTQRALIGRRRLKRIARAKSPKGGGAVPLCAYLLVERDDGSAHGSVIRTRLRLRLQQEHRDPSGGGQR